MQLSARQTSRWPRWLPSGESLAWMGLGALLVGLELVGRVTERDLHDLLAAFALLSALLLLAMRRKQQSISGLARAGVQVLRWLDLFRYDHGFDLRGTPAYPARLPPVFWVLWLALSAWFCTAAGLWYLFPQGWRELGVNTSYVLYLCVFSLVWLSLIAGIILSLWTTLRVLDEQFRRFTGKRSRELRGLEFLLLIGYLMTLMMLGNWVPPLFAPLLCILIVASACLLLLRKRREVPAFLWRFGPGRPIFSVTSARTIAAISAVAAFLVACLVLTACGGHMWERPDNADPMLLTHLIGVTAGWMMPGLFLLFAVRLGSTLHDDPANRSRLVLYVKTTETQGPQAKSIRECLERQGIDCEFVAGKIPKGEVGIEIVPQEQSQALEFQPKWPLAVSLEDLVQGDVFARILRRDELVLKRRALRGVRKLMAKAAEVRKRRGGGYLFAPQWWIIDGMQREEPGRAGMPGVPRVLKPTYQQLFAPRVRQYWHQVLRALQIDMIFLEDGVSAPVFERILRSVFEIYDKHAGQRRAEDHLLPHFPKTRIQIDDWAPGAGLSAQRDDVPAYRERQYDELHRARVMMIFRDDEGEKVFEEDPYDISWEPSPGLGVH